jgi:phosphoserine phosphatase
MTPARRGRSTPRTVVLLGPQRLVPTLKDAIEPLLDAGDSVAAVTAGWEERETEVDELARHLGRAVTNLELYRRAEEAFGRDPDLQGALLGLHEKLHALQQLYRLRLRYLAPAAEELLLRDGQQDLLEPERDSAFAHLRSLDEHHLARVASLRREFLAEWEPSARPAIAEHRAEIASCLDRSAALCIAGGHVRILVNRLWIFDLVGLLGRDLPIVAWSAGAMALTERVVLFHDNPPQGKGWAEVLGPGLGICPGLVALPHARRRLHLEDSVRVQLLSRRFPEATCVALDERTELTFDGRSWLATAPTLQLTAGGALAPAFEGGVN